MQQIVDVQKILLANQKLGAINADYLRELGHWRKLIADYLSGSELSEDLLQDIRDFAMKKGLVDG